MEVRRNEFLASNIHWAEFTWKAYKKKLDMIIAFRRRQKIG